jgi:hypothetical protein
MKISSDFFQNLLLLRYFVLQFLWDVILQAKCYLFCHELIDLSSNAIVHLILCKDEQAAYDERHTLFLQEFYYLALKNMVQDHCAKRN